MVSNKVLITRLLKWLSKADEDFHPEVRREFCVNSAENMIDVMEGVLWMAERYGQDVLRQSSNNPSKFKFQQGFTVIVGFIRKSSSGALVSLDTADFHIAGKEGSWLA